MTFYGLNDDYKIAIYEEFFQLKYWGGWSFFEAYNLPVGLRKWFLEKLRKQFEFENEQIENSRKKR